MALVNCIECGSSVSDKAPTCPKCGVSGPSGKKLQGKLVVKRLWGWNSAAVSIEVFVNRTVVGRVKNNNELSIDLPVGSHEVTFGHTGLNRFFDMNERQRNGSGGAMVQINTGETTTIEIKMGLSGLYIVSSSNL